MSYIKIAHAWSLGSNRPVLLSFKSPCKGWWHGVREAPINGFYHLYVSDVMQHRGAKMMYDAMVGVRM